MTPQSKKGVSAAHKEAPNSVRHSKRFETTVPDLDSLLLLTACIHFY